MHRSKIKNIILHKSAPKSRCPLEGINDFTVNVIKRQLGCMPITPNEKIRIIDEIIRILKSDGL